MIDASEKRAFLEEIMKIPSLMDRENRDALLLRFPERYISLVQRSPIAVQDLSRILEFVLTLGVIDNNELALDYLYKNLVSLAPRETEFGKGIEEKYRILRSALLNEQSKHENLNSLNEKPSDYLTTESGEPILTEAGDHIVVETAEKRTLGELDNLPLDQLDRFTHGELDDKSLELGKSNLDVSGKPIVSEPLADTSEQEPLPVDTRESVSQSPEKREVVKVRGKALSDILSEVDLLGFADYVEALSQFIESKETQKPITIGIDAPWGGGKSTLMRMLEKRLGPKPIPDARWWQKKQTDGFFNVWFNAWKYDEEESLWGALVLEILEQVGKQLGWQRRTKIWFSLNWQRFDWPRLGADLATSLGLVLVVGLVGYLGLVGLALVLGLPLFDTLNVWIRHYTKVLAGFGLVSLLYEAGKDFLNTFTSPFSLGVAKYVKSPDYKSKVGFIGQFQDDFKSVIDAVTESGKWPLIVFIDDLDRCTPAKAASVIEAINLLLDSQHCIFIIGMDARVLSMSIQAKYKDLQESFKEAEKPVGPSLGRHFLEKIIQIDFHVPIPDEAHIYEFIDAQLGIQEKSVQVQSEQKIAESLIRAEQRAGKSLEEAGQSVEQTIPELTPEVIQQAKQEIREITFEESDVVRNSIKFIAKYLDFNPRQIKRFINMYRLQALIAYQRRLLEREDGIEIDQLAIWILISMRWSEFFDEVSKKHGFAYRFQRIVAQLENIPPESEVEFYQSLPSNILRKGIRELLKDKDLLALLREISVETAYVTRYMQVVQTAAPKKPTELSEQVDALWNS